MKNLKRADPSERRMLDLHLKYICLLSVILLTCAVCVVVVDIYTRDLRRRVDTVEKGFTDELDASLSKLSTALDDAASVSDPSVFSTKITDACMICGRICGALSIEREFECDLLARYLTLLSDELETLRQHTFLEMAVGESAHEYCVSAAANVRRIATQGKDGSAYSAAKIKLIVSPLI